MSTSPSCCRRSGCPRRIAASLVVFVIGGLAADRAGRRWWLVTTRGPSRLFLAITLCESWRDVGARARAPAPRSPATVESGPRSTWSCRGLGENFRFVSVPCRVTLQGVWKPQPLCDLRPRHHCVLDSSAASEVLNTSWSRRTLGLAAPAAVVMEFEVVSTRWRLGGQSLLIARAGSFESWTRGFGNAAARLLFLVMFQASGPGQPGRPASSWASPSTACSPCRTSKPTQPHRVENVSHQHLPRHQPILSCRRNGGGAPDYRRIARGPAVAVTRVTSSGSVSVARVRYTVSSEMVGTLRRTPR